jgi:neutral ceramidase
VSALPYSITDIQIANVHADPRNNLRLNGTFALVESFDYEAKIWRSFRDDADWSLVYEWKRTSSALGTSEVEIRWETMWETNAWRGNEAAEVHGDLLLSRSRSTGKDLKGLYRLRYYGDAKAFGGGITAFEGISGEFRIIA